MATEKTTKKEIDKLCLKIISTAIDVHKELGPNQIGPIYTSILKHVLKQQGINFQTNFYVPVNYKNEILEADLNIGLIVEEKVLVAVKNDPFTPNHTSQLLTYMNFVRAAKGVLLNFNSKNLFHEGYRIIASGLYQGLV